MKYMNSYPKILGTIFIVMVTLVGISPFLSSANAMDVNFSDLQCIVQIGTVNNDCSHDNTEASTTTNNIDNPTINNNNSLTNSCNGQRDGFLSITNSNNTTAQDVSSQDWCRGLGAISLPN